MAITTIPPGSAGIPTSKTTVAENDPAIPTSKTTVSEASAAIPTSKTTVSAASAAIPTSKTTVSEASTAIPTSKTTVSAAAAAIPTAKTTIGAAAVPRALTPLVDMHFDSQNYSQNGNAVSFDGLFTYTRASSATFINRRVVNNKAEYFLDTDFVGTVENLVTFSEQFNNGDWVKTRSSISSNSTKSPLGDNTADKLTEDVTASNTHSMQQVFASFTSGNTYTFSIRVKSGERSNIRLALETAAFPASSFVSFNLVGVGSITFLGNSTIVGFIRKIDDDWFEISITETSDSTVSGFVQCFILSGINVATYTGDGVSGLFIWGAQLTESVKSLPYVKTTGTSDSLTFSESVRIEYDPITGEVLGLKNEEASTNLLTRSEEFDHANWSKSQSSIATNSTLAPDGTYSADTLVEDSTASSVHNVIQSVSFTSGNSYTFSVMVKEKERNQISLLLGSGAFGANVRYDFTDFDGGVIVETTPGTNSSAKIKPLFGGWFMCSITSEATSSAASNAQISLMEAGSATYNGDGVSGLFVWGSMVEALEVLTSYIKTEASTVTRAKDLLTIPVAGNDPADSSDSTHFVRMNLPTLPAGGSGSNREPYNAVGTSGSSSMRVGSTGILEAIRGSLAPDIAADGAFSSQLSVASVFTRSDNNIQGYIDGVVAGGGDAGTIYLQDQSTVMGIGSTGAGVGNLNGHIKELAIYDIALTAQEVSLL